MRSLRSARRRASVRSSSAPARRLKPTTSAARIAASFRVSLTERLLSHNACLAEPLAQPIDVGRVAERQPSDMFGEGVFRIDLHQFAPDPPGLVGLAQMAEGDGKKGAREISPGRDPDALLELRSSVFVLAGDQVGRTEKVDA